jgi:hypothetical protein
LTNEYVNPPHLKPGIVIRAFLIYNIIRGDPAKGKAVLGNGVTKSDYSYSYKSE